MMNSYLITFDLVVIFVVIFGIAILTAIALGPFVTNLILRDK